MNGLIFVNFSYCRDSIETGPQTDDFYADESSDSDTQIKAKERPLYVYIEDLQLSSSPKHHYTKSVRTRRSADNDVHRKLNSESLSSMSIYTL